MTKSRLILLLLASAAVLGGGLALNSATGARAAVAPAATNAAGIDPRAGGFEIALGEWAISPEAKAIRPGLVTFVISNRGKFRHGLGSRSGASTTTATTIAATTTPSR